MSQEQPMVPNASKHSEVKLEHGSYSNSKNVP